MFTAKIREKSIGKMRPMRLLAVLLVPMVALIMGAAAPEASAFGFGDFCVVELDEAEVFFEYNSTDEDRGIQFFWDGEPWKWMIVKNDRNRTVLNVIAQRNVKAQGLTEGFFESAEPEESDLSEAEFFARFPEGDYSFKGMTLDGCWLVGSSMLSHDLPDPPEINSPDEDFDDFEDFEDSDFVANPIIEWTFAAGVDEYEVVAEVEIDGSTYVNTATLQGDAIQFTVSPEFMQMALYAEDDLEVFKVEVIARANLNKTITEFAVYEKPEED